MYIPSHFKEEDLAEIRLIVETFPLATCIAMAGDEFEINHIPMVWRDDVLIGHIAMANVMHRSLVNGTHAAFVFQAENSYISPNWYPSKQVHHQVVPTWNYQVVHMHGDLYFYHQDKAKLAAVGMLTQHHEDRVNGSEAWKMRDAPREFIKKKLDAIVAVEFKIQRIEAKSKLSQNRDSGDFDAVADKMQDLNLGGIARRMQKLKSDVG